MPGVPKTRQEKPKPYGSSMGLPSRRQPGTSNLPIILHEPGDYCFYDFCPCDQDPMAIRNPPGRAVVDPASLVANRPMYRYMCFVNALRRKERREQLHAERKAAAKREEDRQEKLRAEREAAAAAVEASKKDKASKDQPKND